MTFSNQTKRTSVVGDGTTQDIPFSFPASATSEIEVRSRVIATGVESNPLIEDTDYSIVLSGDTGGTVTMITTFAATSQIHVIRNTDNTQLLDLEQGGSFNAENLEDAFDKATKLTIENKDSLERTLVFPTTDPSSSFADMPNSVDRASKNLTFDSAGKPTASVAVEEGSVSFTTYGENVVGSANALAGKTVLGLDHVVDVRDFGAEGDGAADDTSSIQAAIDSIAIYTASAVAPKRSLGGGTVFLPKGTYKITGTLKVYQNIIFLGAGKDATRIEFSGSSDNVIELTYKTVTDVTYKKINIHVRDLTIDCGGSTNVGISSDNTAGLIVSSIRDVTIREGQVGIRIEGGWRSSYTDLDIMNCIVGFAGLVTDASQGFNSNTFVNVNCSRFTRHGAFITGNANTFTTCQFQVDQFTGADSAPSNIASHAFPVGLEIFGKDTSGLALISGNNRKNVVDNCWFEAIEDSSNGAGIYLDNVEKSGANPLLQGTSIRQCFFNGDVDMGIIINEAFLTDITFCHFTTAAKGITLQSEADQTVIKNNGTVTITDNSGGRYTLERYEGFQARNTYENRKLDVLTFTVDTALTLAQSGNIFDNLGDTGDIIFTLPDAVEGLVYTFIQHTSVHKLIIDPQAGDFIRPINFETAGDKIVNDSQLGASITLLATSGANWAATAITGLWVNGESLDVASLTTTTLPVTGAYFNITGTNNITTLTASREGRIVTLKFAAILDFTDGNNLKLVSTFTTSADDTIQLVSNGTNWYEISRSVN